VITQIRIIVLLARPSLVVLFGLFAATGLAEAGRGDDAMALAAVLVVVVGFVLFSVVLNDLADRAIDRVNLPGDPRRPLVCGFGRDRDFAVVAATAAVVAVVQAARLGPGVLVTVVAGLALSASYSLRPIRIAERGAMASLLLPAGYVAVPYLAGLLSVRCAVTPRDLLLGGGLYIGFIGRILLKDFRDVRGDALFGKRTFLVRHGRAATCAFSATCWMLGTIALLGVRGASWSLIAIYATQVGVAFALLWALACDGGARRDERLIAAIAIIGRAMVVTLIAHLSMTDARCPAAAQFVVTVGFAAISIVQAATMARLGPVARHSQGDWRAFDGGMTRISHADAHSALSGT